MPAYKVIVPPDAEAQKYGVPAGLRAKRRPAPDGRGHRRRQDHRPRLQPLVRLQITKAEFVATLKYTLDTRRRGNRAPFLFGMHSAIY